MGVQHSCPDLYSCARNIHVHVEPHLTCVNLIILRELTYVNTSAHTRFYTYNMLDYYTIIVTHLKNINVISHKNYREIHQ